MLSGLSGLGASRVFVAVVSRSALLATLLLASCAACIVNADAPRFHASVADVAPSIVMIVRTTHVMTHFGVVQQRASGTGFVAVDGANRKVVVTAGHVCRTPDGAAAVEFTAQTIDGMTHRAVVVRIDEVDDLCAMRVAGVTARPLSVARLSPAIGEPVVLVGAPQGVFGRRLLAVLDGRWAGFDGEHSTITLFGAPGASGAPVLTRSGRVVGVYVALSLRWPALGFAVPRRNLVDFLAEAGG